MQIIIELSDETYKDIKEENGIYGINNGLSARITGKVVGAIQSGTLLPKGYDKLKDEDAISRQAVLDLCDSKDLEYKVEHLREDVECLPPVTLHPKTGHWIKEPMDLVRCSKCGYKGVRRLANNYCPNCGAKMEEELQWFDIA